MKLCIRYKMFKQDIFISNVHNTLPFHYTEVGGEGYAKVWLDPPGEDTFAQVRILVQSLMTYWPERPVSKPATLNGCLGLPKL